MGAVNEEKSKFQEKGRELSEKHPFLAIQAATGSGKGLLVMKCIDADKSNLKWLVLVPETLQIINLQDDIKKHNMEYIYEKIEDIICYASLHKFQGKSLNVWLNECHRLSECRADLSKTIKYKRIIADSATINGEIKERLAQLGHFHYLTLSLQKAIETGIIPPPTVYTIPVELDNIKKRNKTKFGDKYYYLTDWEYIGNLDKSLEYWKKRLSEKPKEKWIVGKFNTIGNERKSFFSKCKLESTKMLIKNLENKRFVCFTGGTEQCDELGGNRAIHGKRGRKHNVSALEKFNLKEINSVYFYKMGREGMNLAGIEAVIIQQLSTGNDEGLEFLQTSGRSYRSDAPEVYILYCKGTKDEEFLNKSLTHVNRKYVKELKL